MTASLLDDVEDFLARFVAFPSEHARVAAVLWATHAHLLDAFESTPRLAALGPEPGVGKTRLLEILELLVPRPLHAVNATPSALFRRVSSEDGRPTILFDEIDAVFGPKAKDNEDLRGLLNAGHRRGATATRCVVRGKNVDVEDFPAYAAVALAGLGDLPDTLMTRSVVIRMRRRAPHEHVEPFRHRVHAPAGHALRDQLAAWAANIAGQVTDAWPDMPDGVEDRNADVWEPLLAVADAAGGTWPQRARVAAVAAVAEARGGQSASLGIRLLADLHGIFTDEDQLPSEVILERLCALDEAPWGDLYGKPIDHRGLAKRLRNYRTADNEPIAPRNIREGERVVKGYTRADLCDAWVRYLPPPSPPAESATPATASTPSVPCSACDEPMVPLEPWQTAHPSCEPVARSA